MLNEKQKEKIIKTLGNHSSSIIKIEDIYNIVSKILKISVIELKTVEYDIFFKVVKELEKDEILKPYGKNMNSMMLKSLSLKFKILNRVKKEESISNEDKLFLYSLNSKINTSFYFKNFKELKNDKDNLIKLSNFLDNLNENTPYISMNERSYELFGYEKCLSGAGVTSSLLQRTKIELDTIHCFDTYTPLQCHMMHGFYKKKARNILIVENLDTYWSFHRAMNDSVLGDKIDMLVYGCGNKASGNFKFHRHYSITEDDNIYYFGDIDPEGLAIYKRVKSANPTLNIILSERLYNLAIQIGLEKGVYDINNKNQSKINEDEIDKLLETLNEYTALKFKKIILAGKYIPQEAVNYRVLVEKIKKEGE